MPPATAASVATIGERWIEHRVAPGERIAEISELYGVSSEQVIAWNKLNKERPMIRTGQQLRIQTSAPSRSRSRSSYTVRRGDTWSTLAKRFEVTVTRLRDHWNDGEEALTRGSRIVVFKLPEPEGVQLAPATPAAPATPTVATAPAAAKITATPSSLPAAAPAPAPLATKVATTVAPTVPALTVARSHGRPDRGRILNAAQLPANDALYKLRNPSHSWASAFTIEQLTRALQRFRSTGFDREIVIQDMSLKGGGRFKPHESHQSGRDVDIRLPLKEGVPTGTIPESPSLVDWDATWMLVLSMLYTEQVRYIFLSRTHQKLLYEAALRNGATKEELADLMQYPRTTRTAVIRHARGHNKHFHVRFNCGPLDKSCTD